MASAAGPDNCERCALSFPSRASHSIKNTMSVYYLYNTPCTLAFLDTSTHSRPSPLHCWHQFPRESTYWTMVRSGVILFWSADYYLLSTKYIHRCHYFYITLLLFGYRFDSFYYKIGKEKLGFRNGTSHPPLVEAPIRPYPRTVVIKSSRQTTLPAATTKQKPRSHESRRKCIV